PEPWAQAVAAQADPLLAYPHTAGARDAQVAAGGAARVRGRSERTDAHAVCGADVAAAAARSVQVDRVGLDPAIALDGGGIRKSHPARHVFCGMSDRKSTR